jgi:DNA-binding NtrC family response regulator
VKAPVSGLAEAPLSSGTKGGAGCLMVAWRVLAVDDEPDVLRCRVEALQGLPEVTVDEASCFAAAMALLEFRAYDLFVCDEALPDGRGLALLKWVGMAIPPRGSCW